MSPLCVFFFNAGIGPLMFVTICCCVGPIGKPF